MIVDRIKGYLNEGRTGNRRIDPVLMDHYDLTKPHQKVTSVGGEVIAISLEQGESLAPGAILYEDENKVIAVELRPEDVLRIVPRGNIEWARAAFNIGNMHQAAYVHEDCILAAYDGILEDLINRLGIECERLTCPLQGIRAGVTQIHHHHHGEHHHG